MRPATAACNNAILAIIHNCSVDYSAEMNFANEPCLGVPNHIMNVNRQNVLGGQRALLVGLTRSVWDDVFGAIRGWPGVRGWPGNGGPSADGLASPTKMKTFWVIKYLNIYSTNK